VLEHVRKLDASIVQDPAVTHEYLRAAVLCDQLKSVDLSALLGGQEGQKGMSPILRLADGPVPVVLEEPHRRHFWNLLRTSVVVLILVAGASVLFETLASNFQKGMGMSKSWEPVRDIQTRLTDVCGCDEVKRELDEIICYLQHPERFTKIGAVLPKGIMMTGPPGVGKTLIARAIAGEASVPFISASGSEFEEMYVGVGARRIRELFSAARQNSPCILFIDEIDAVGSKRNARDNSAVRMTLNQLLIELDGFSTNEGVVVLCATNYPQSLDPALTRPGRLDRTVVVPSPDLKGREELLSLYAGKVSLDEDVDLEIFARRTTGMTGADLANLINIAAIRSAVSGRQTVNTAVRI
jgi:ATP-dependent metalloprotease FtsH